jgi:hypothetical protein
MAIFGPDERVWSHIDYATIASHGIACVDPLLAADCRSWLWRHGYRSTALDCSGTLPDLCRQLSEVLDWPGQFGYEFRGHSLDALRDGFGFDVPDEGGMVLELIHPDVMWETERKFMARLLAIASEHTRVQMAEGKRFFTILIVEPDARIIGDTFDKRRVPLVWWQPERDDNPFRD